VITVWAQRADKAALIVHTTDFGVDQTFVKDNTVIIMTSGGNRSQVFVFQFKAGSPRLLLRQVTKGDALICTRAGRLTLTIDGIFAGNSPPRSKTLQLETSWGELEPHLK
jgi:hypothetical protein